MSRIFLALATFVVLLLAANLLVGLAMGDFGKTSRAYQHSFHQYEALTEDSSTRAELDEAKESRDAAMLGLRNQRSGFWLHIWLGITAALATLLVNSISVTYFIGTNRWSREVVAAFSLPSEFAERSQALKRKAFPWSLLGILLILLIAGLGAACDPATLNPDAADWVEYHWGLGMVGVAVIAACFFFQVSAIGKNFKLINEIVAAAEAERERRKPTTEQGDREPQSRAPVE